MHAHQGRGLGQRVADQDRHMLDALVQRAEGDQPGVARGIQRHGDLRHLGERGGELQRVGQQIRGRDGEQIRARGKAGPAGLDRSHDHGGSRRASLPSARAAWAASGASTISNFGRICSIVGSAARFSVAASISGRASFKAMTGLAGFRGCFTTAAAREGASSSIAWPLESRSITRSPSAPTVSAGAMSRGRRAANTTGTPRLASAMARCTARVRGVPSEASAVFNPVVIDR